MGVKLGLIIVSIILIVAGYFVVRFAGPLGLIILFASLIIGFGGGYFLSKIKVRRENKIIERNAREVLAGKRKNAIEIDGVEYDATKFKVRNEDDNEVLIDLEGGGIIKNVKRKIKKRKKRKRKNQIKDCSTVREDVPSIRKKKRDTRTIIRRIRRFG